MPITGAETMIDRNADAELRQYYARRAGEYEAIYAKPERQADLARMKAAATDAFRGRRVIEIACGTGWWSQHIAQTAASLDAFDINDETLAIARMKPIATGRARFAVGDAYAPPMPAQPYDGAFAGFWWSHVYKRDLPRFLEGLHRVLAPGAKVVFLDNAYVEGSSTPVSRVDENGDSYQLRKLSDGTQHEVLKNFPSADELKRIVAPYARDARVDLYDHYWWLEYALPRE
jgi:demethylmenaquinone methyltransferase/2-methoxy-6-polyprenyl-1,4-benzoquinol methylase